MNESATRADIDEVIGIIRDFMQQVDDRFSIIKKEIIELKESHNRLLKTIDGFIWSH